jgi:hypothetical protein
MRNLAADDGRLLGNGGRRNGDTGDDALTDATADDEEAVVEDAAEGEPPALDAGPAPAEVGGAAPFDGEARGS